MTYEIIWADEALAAAETFMVDDTDGLLAVFGAVDQLAEDPRPLGAVSWGVDRYRFHVGRYRVLYEITDKTVTVDVIHLGRVG